MLGIRFTSFPDRIGKWDISVTTILGVMQCKDAGIKIYIAEPEITYFRYTQPAAVKYPENNRQSQMHVFRNFLRLCGINFLDNRVDLVMRKNVWYKRIRI